MTAIPLKAPARDRLSQLLRATVLDIRQAGDHADLVLSPSSSPQLLWALRARFPGARVVVVELTDDDYGIDLGGPVQRLMRAGADDYVSATGLDALAAALRRDQRREAVDAPEVHELPAAERDLIASVLADLAARTTRPQETAGRDD